jgi:PAS domain S-box-containing protein
MASGETNALDARLRRRRAFVAAVTRWTSALLGLVALVLAADRPEARLVPGLAIVAAYVVFNLASARRLARRPNDRALKVVHDVVDALALGVVAYFSGGSRSLAALVLYPHVVAVSVRGGFAYALAMGALDGGMMWALSLFTPEDSLGVLHVLVFLACAVMGGVTSSHLHEVRALLRAANHELAATNEQLTAGLAAAEVARTEQDEALARLRVSEERYRRLLEGIQDGVLIVQAGRVAYCNQVFAALLGEARDALTGRALLELALPADREDLARTYERWERGEGPAATLETRLLARAGETRHVSLRAGTAEFEGAPAVIATVRDISRERRMEQDLKAHAERLAAINEIANAVNLNLTIEDILAVAGEEARRLVPFDHLGLALLSEDQPEIEVIAVARGAETRRLPLTRTDLAWAWRRPVAWCRSGLLAPPPHYEHLFEERDIEAFASLPLLSKDRVIGSLNLGRRAGQPFSAWDLAVLEPLARHIALALDNARLLLAVRRRGDELESLLEISRGILERLELHELLPRVTRAVNRVMGTRECLLLLRSGTELRLAAHEGLEPEVVAATGLLRVGESLSGWVAQHGQPLALLEMRSDPRVAFPELIERFGLRSFLCVPLVHGNDVLGTLEVTTREPRRFTAEEQAQMGALADQAAVAIANARLYEEARTHLAQVTRAHARLEELDRQRREYLRNVSHEFRTPLTVIKGYGEYLRDADPAGIDVRGIMRVVLESCERVIDMVDTLIDINRVEQARAWDSLHVQPLDLREVCSSAIETLRSLAERKHLALELQFPADPLRGLGDAGLLQQVVRKLVDNALKYSAPEGRVVVRARAEGEELALEVEDRGIGIAPEHLPRIFDKFYMVDGGLTRRVGGSGVGLYLVREIMRLHDGRVEVESAPGEGSLFRVCLPRAPRGAAAEVRV